MCRKFCRIIEEFLTEVAPYHQLALNVVLLPYFRQGHSLIFHSVVPYFGIVTWAWMLGVTEPLLLLVYGQLLLSRGGPLRLSRYATASLRLLSLLLTSTSGVLILVTTLSHSFARFVSVLNVLNLLVNALICMVVIGRQAPTSKNSC